MSYQVYSPTPHAYVPYGNGSVSHNGAIPNAFQNGGLSPGGYSASHPGGGGGFVFRKRHERVDWRKIGKDAHIRICREGYMVLARIFKMPVQNSNSNISARPYLATNLLQILMTATINSLLCQKGQLTLHLFPIRWFARKIFGYYPPKVKIENS